MGYFFDSYAIIECIGDNKSYDKFQDEIMITTILNLVEVYYSILRRFDHNIAESTIKRLNVQIIEIDLNIALEAAKFRHENYKRSLSYIDCIWYLIARKNNLRFLTGDKQFENKEDVEFVK